MLPIRCNQMQFRRPLLAEDCTCGPQATVLKIEYSSLLLVSEPEFHEEWLRDGPCDATTTCLGKPGVWCQLSPKVPKGIGEHEIRGASSLRISPIPCCTEVLLSSSRGARALAALDKR